MTGYPEAFIARMRERLGDEADVFFTALDQPYQRGLRINPCKPACLPDALGVLAPVPWWPQTGRYLRLDSLAGVDALHEAGAYYLQEPSAMAAVSALAPKPGERVLDLCAAPGGKSTQIADALGGSGLLVANEPVPTRARVLSRNIERMGVTNALVVSADPERLESLWPSAFDAILVDAPCSGEGMFRRHPEARDEWREDSPAGCAARQRRILTSAVRMLKPGGRLAYSTCTLNREENDDMAAWLTQSEPCMQPLAFALDIGDGRTLDATDGFVQLYPHRVLGEGHFVALFTKTDDTGGHTDFAPASDRLNAPERASVAAWRELGLDAIDLNAMLGDALIAAPDLPPLAGVRVLRAGLQLGTLSGKVFLPDHALAMGLAHPLTAPHMELDADMARAYLRGEALPADNGSRGWALAVYQGLALGFVKLSNGQAKNHYPKGLRRP